MASPAGPLTPLGLELPPVVHAVLEPGATRGRVIVVGDVHGCLTEFKQLLAKVGYRKEADTLILVGDLGNKGPHSAEVVRYVRELPALCVRGNHDEMSAHNWRAVQLGHTAAEALPEEVRWVAGLSAEDAAYLAALPFSLTLPSHGLRVVHAGVLPGLPLAQQSLVDLIDLRQVGRDAEGAYRALPKFPRNAGKPWAGEYGGPEHCVFGHHAKLRLQRRRFATGIDTGCVVGDQLTALVLPPKEEVGEAVAAALRGPGVTLEDLRGELVSVPALQCYRED